MEEKRDGGLTVRLRGERLNGLWTLIPTRMDGDERNWLIVRKDEGDLAGDPAELRPMLAVAATELPTRGEWVYEVKWDGYRVIAAVEGGEATLRSRNGNDLTARFAQVARALPGALRSADCVLDGEVCALDEQGRPRFSLLQHGGGALAMYAFDLFDPRRPRRDRPAARRAQGAARRDADRRRDHPALGRLRRRPGAVRAGRAHGLEGVIAKRPSSRYLRDGAASPG